LNRPFPATDSNGSGPACWETLVFPIPGRYRKAAVAAMAARANGPRAGRFRCTPWVRTRPRAVL